MMRKSDVDASLFAFCYGFSVIFRVRKFGIGLAKVKGRENEIMNYRKFSAGEAE
ncbi:hypothetical protein [Aneurinibacillus aneurinilyticus]|uniref:hypothetical protein n=1 Tax=Aneurinibacillus aneurinilyticus TaxID=1391 RepID=UPI0023F262D3|nr:hypothetical protein [Aneurinibacillus aneurinilyticus]MED0669176.1 hypothetical protein [Aneurinibacillus aneurinilyticus]